MMSAAALLLLLLPLVSAQTFNWGPCPNPQVQPNFNLQQYLGKWYEIEKLPTNFARGKCIEANYSLRKDGTIRVLNSQVINGKVEDTLGTAKVQDKQEPAKLGVSFSYFSPDGPYWVLKSDYTNMSVVYSCTDILHLFHIDFAWILSRSSSLSPEKVTDAKNLLINEGIDISRMKPSDQSGCGFNGEP